MSKPSAESASGQREKRRLDAARLLRTTDLSKAEIARRLGVSRAAVTQWSQQLKKRRRGDDGLRGRPHTGRPARLSGKDWRRVLTLLRRGPRASGFTTGRWTLARVRQLIQGEFGLSYSTSYLAEKLNDLDRGWRELAPKRRKRYVQQVLVEPPNHWAMRAMYKRPF
jgi:transposase